MNLRRLRYFIVLGRELHFTRAAEILHIAQPALSQQIQAFERELGVELLVRSSRSVRLTDAGAVLLAEGETLLAQVDGVLERTIAAAQGLGGTLRIAYTRSAIDLGTHDLVQLYRRTFPSVRLQTSTGWTSHSIGLLRRDGTDVAFVRLPLLDSPDIETLQLGSEELVVVLPADHALAAKTRVSRRDLLDEPVVSWPRDQGEGYHDSIASQVWAPQRPRVVQEEPDAENILAAVADGAGIAVLDRRRAEKLRPRTVVVRRFSGVVPRAAYGLAWLAGGSRPLVTDFVATCAGTLAAGQRAADVRPAG